MAWLTAFLTQKVERWYHFLKVLSDLDKFIKNKRFLFEVTLMIWQLCNNSPIKIKLCKISKIETTQPKLSQTIVSYHPELLSIKSPPFFCSLLNIWITSRPISICHLFVHHLVLGLDPHSIGLPHYMAELLLRYILLAGPISLG